VPFYKDENYIAELNDEVERLIIAANGHTAVLFTSYSVMNIVYTNLQECGLPYDFFKLERASSNAIEQFKKSDNGVLFASGALWEGIDIPGDALSQLIIVKLPFSVPDAVSEYERSQYADSRAYLSEVLIPEMLIKLKQGYGRSLRTESDTCVIALLDVRAGERGTYRQAVINALPPSRVTKLISEITAFLLAKKPDEYWKQPKRA
jgi:ATP-dependent DNA helicase DinG